MSVVREFCVDAIEHRDFREFVRGKWIAFDRTSINKFYNLPDVDKDDYFKFREEGVEPENYFVY